MQTEIALTTVVGIIQYAPNEKSMLARFNQHGNHYEIRDGLNGRELWHKGTNTFSGVLETIMARDVDTQRAAFRKAVLDAMNEYAKEHGYARATADLPELFRVLAAISDRIHNR